MPADLKRWAQLAGPPAQPCSALSHQPVSDLLILPAADSFRNDAGGAIDRNVGRPILQGFLEHILDILFGHGSDDLVHGLAILEKNEGWNAHHPEPLRHGLCIVHVQLSNFRLPGVLFSQRLDVRCNHSAGGAPCGPKINKDGNFRLKHLRLKVCVAQFLDMCCGHR